jgi:hypothetical protein
MKIYLLFISLLLFTSQLFCQDSTSLTRTEKKINQVKANSSADLMIAVNSIIPAAQTKDVIQNNIGDLGFGLSAIALFNPFTKKNKNFPVHLGLEAGYTYFGRFKTEVNVNGFKGDYKTTYGLFSLNAVIRFRPSYTYRFTPFADVFAGGNFYNAEIKENLNAIETALNTPKTYLGGYNSASFSKGIAVGFNIGKAETDAAKFSCRLAYTIGSNINYLVRNSLVYDGANNKLVFDKAKAPLKYFMLQIGVAF